jgi:hypothetical protein
MTAFTIKKQLPSRGKYGLLSVMLSRPVLQSVVDYLQSDNSLDSKLVFVQSNVQENIDNLPYGDIEFLFANLRGLINSTTITGVLPCTKKDCGSEVVYVLDLTTCRVNQLPDDFVADYKHKLPVSGDTLNMNVFRVRDVKLVDSYITYYDTADGELPNVDLGDNLYEFARYACMTRNVESVEELDKQVSYLRSLDWTDFESILLYDVMFECGPVLRVDTKCDKCGQKYGISVKTDSTFFGLSLEGLINRHRFLARTVGVTFSDFCKYTVPVMDAVSIGETERVREQKSKRKGR